MIIIKSHHQNQDAKALRHEGVRVGEIVAYRAWRVIPANWFRKASARLHSVFVYDYAWDTNAPAWGDVRSHGIYSFRDQIRCRRDYGYRFILGGPLLFGTVKIWGEIVEHEAGYRSEFAKIVSLDYGDPQLLEKFRKIYRLAPGPIKRTARADYTQVAIEPDEGLADRFHDRFCQRSFVLDLAQGFVSPSV